MALWPAAHNRPHLQVGYMAAPTSTCKSERNPLPTESRPYTAPRLAVRMMSGSVSCWFDLNGRIGGGKRTGRFWAATLGELPFTSPMSFNGNAPPCWTFGGRTGRPDTGRSCGNAGRAGTCQPRRDISASSDDNVRGCCERWVRLRVSRYISSSAQHRTHR